MGSASAILGPLCDVLHSAHGVLTNSHPVALAFPPGAPPLLETTWWTPLLFAGAGVALGAGLPLMDALPGAPAPRLGAAPPWSLVLISIATFVGTYYASAVGDGDAALRVRGRLGALLAAAAAVHWALLDATPQGAAMAALAAAAGPALEAGLI
jgi:hypothetical protein